MVAAIALAALVIAVAALGLAVFALLGVIGIAADLSDDK